VIAGTGIPDYFYVLKITAMKKKARQILFFGSLGAWALFAIRSGQSHSHRCNAEWKLALKNLSENVPVAVNKSINKNTDETRVDVHYPGFMNLLFP
jgi:hypothetical protein